MVNAHLYAHYHGQFSQFLSIDFANFVCTQAVVIGVNFVVVGVIV